ncbi:hypothetical protein PC9H_003533 [Pleurotus ostreatus]|uniref:Uncharacterized protein n=1 Tax=Pleurotus ostreatus TaxID=5322 RepID=A0A8H7DVG2_PLEOS|nr:uncharacterized protein PC9H_003533 [Pleurotus ostreatus]KAF7436700.1 hypothetical protein PC9H_003533 [Pleurotus ostreatus]
MPASDVSLSDMHSEASIDSEEEYLLAQQEWEESLQQLQQLVGALLLPYFGKWLGRQTSHWGTSALRCYLRTRLYVQFDSVRKISASGPWKGFLRAALKLVQLP